MRKAISPMRRVSPTARPIRVSSADWTSARRSPMSVSSGAAGDVTRRP